MKNTNVLRIGVSNEGKIVFSINGESSEYAPSASVVIIDVIKCAESDARDIIELNKKRDSVLKNYNDTGKTIPKS